MVLKLRETMTEEPEFEKLPQCLVRQVGGSGREGQVKWFNKSVGALTLMHLPHVCMKIHKNPRKVSPIDPPRHCGQRHPKGCAANLLPDQNRAKKPKSSTVKAKILKNMVAPPPPQPIHIRYTLPFSVVLG